MPRGLEPRELLTALSRISAGLSRLSHRYLTIGPKVVGARCRRWSRCPGLAPGLSPFEAIISRRGWVYC